MKHFVGIDLGTTNSAICSYDGTDTRIWKSPEQNDVTPSAIYIDRRGNKYVGKRAYDTAPQSPDNAAMLFKRLMGTSTPIKYAAVGLTMTPEECSAEILKKLFGYLDEEIRRDQISGTVITVPAAFNQMQKDATMQAADMAALGNVALMQEPVAAVMSVLRAHNTDGMFLIYDLGGGTLDVAIAENIGGRVNLLAHGGLSMCGGRDFDRAIMDSIVKPWLMDNFTLPDDLAVSPNYKALMRLATWASEKAKIELSAKDEAMISLTEMEIRAKDLDGQEIYLDIPIKRDTYDRLIEARVEESIEAAREAISSAGLTPNDFERIVFVGGPTHYKPLRDKVCFELAIKGSTEVNPMTAVAEGASLFAESIDWSSQTHYRKSSRAKITSDADLGLTFNYSSRTPGAKAKIMVQMTGKSSAGFEFQVDSIDTGWSSGKMPLKHGATVDVALPRSGDNSFKVFVFNASGSPVTLKKDKIIITKTAAVVDSIPASHSIGIEVMDRLGEESSSLVYLVRKNDSLPKKGSVKFRAGSSLKAGSSESLNFNLWEGEIEDPVKDNRFIGCMKITGDDFDDGVIASGAELECEFEILDSGTINIAVSVPSLGATFRNDRNFYSRQDGQTDYSSSESASMVTDKGERTLERIDEISDKIDSPKLDQAREKLDVVMSIDPDEMDPEVLKEADEKVHEAQKLLADVNKENQKEIRKIDLDKVVSLFNSEVRKLARPSEITSFENKIKTAQRCIDRNDKNFDNVIKEMHGTIFGILWRQDWFVVSQFKHFAQTRGRVTDRSKFNSLVQMGNRLVQSDDIDKLREVIGQLAVLCVDSGGGMNIGDVANILRG